MKHLYYSGWKIPECRGRTLSDGSGTSCSPIFNEVCLREVRGGNRNDYKAGVFERRVTQTETKLVAGSDVFLKQL